jgi:hypothetical protein
MIALGMRSRRGGGRSARLAGAVIAATLIAVATAAAQDAGGAKKVGTERIVVTPPTSTTAPPTVTPQTVTPQTGAPPGFAAPTGPEPETFEDRKAPAVPAPASDPKAPLPEVHEGVEGLPPLVAKMRRKILDAAYSGDMGRLKIAIQASEMPPIFSVNEIGDPVAFLERQSGDGKGMEILAILTDVLEADWVRLDAGKPQEMYVWPAWAAIPPDRLTQAQLVKVYKILTSSDFEEMKSVNHYTFYSIGIGPDGTWHWFKTDN